ncbi:DUF6701 domain-containing protein [Shewanella maritima]|uniref:DUF6701 domain-containing protein n=1 Tax=Shewanella maritima TaxID=2520507 RepID=UPI0037364790
MNKALLTNSINSMLWVMLFMLFTSYDAKADWSSTFIEGVNNIDPSGTITLNTATIINAPTNGQLPTYNYIQNGDSKFKACIPSNGNAKFCQAGDFVAALPQERLDFSQCISSSSDDISAPPSNAPLTQVPEGEYRNITIGGGSGRTIEFTTNNSEGIYKIKSLSGSSGNLIFAPGQYWIENLSLGSSVSLTFPQSGSVTFFVKDDYTHLNLSFSVQPEQFVIYNYGDFTLNGSATLDAHVVSEGNVVLSGSSTLNGAVTGQHVEMGRDAKVVFSDVAQQIDIVPDCNTQAEDSFHLQYGKATSANVVFDTPFDAGVTPLIFLMPTIAEVNSDNDGPASAFLVGTPSNTGFTWSQEESPTTSNRYVPSDTMTEVHWIAVTPGTHDLSNGTQLIAGTIDIDEALFGGNSPYTDVTLPNTQDVLLHQIQTNVNDCWFTTTSQFTNTGMEVALDTSEVRTNGNQCMPARLNNNRIQAESVAYMSVQSGEGSLVLNGENVNYHFGSQAQTFTAGGIQSLSYQCNYTTAINGFTEVPVFVAGKNSRRGGDGGWLRRCQLTNNLVSMVVDEDTYRDTDRRHIWENYSFVALEKDEQVFECFSDDFSRSDVGSDWVVSSSRGNFTPSIVNNRLRVTEAQGNQATSSTYQRLFPAANNLVTIEFDHFAYGGSGADGIAFVLSDAAITPQAGAYGGPLGYGARSTVDGFAGGWLGFGIDEYGNFSTEGGPSGPGRRQQSVAIRGSGSGTTGYDYLRGTCNNGQTNPNGACLTPPVDDNNVSPAHRYRITIDSRIAGQSVVTVERNTGSGYVELIAPFDAAAEPTQSAVPADFLLSLTGSTGGATNNHEIDNVEICALDSNPIGVVIDHFEFDHSGSGLTCNAESMTLKACADANCDNLVLDQVTATLSPATIPAGGGWVGGNVVTFTGGQTTLDLRHNTPGAVTIGVTGSTPGTKPFSQTLCSISGGVANATNCTLTFEDTGFIFGSSTDNTDSGGQFVKFANKPIDMTISAVKKDDSTQQCVPTFANTSKTVSLWSSFISPDINSVAATSAVTINGAGIGQSQAAATPINLTFDAQGEASFTVNYPDAGQMQLDAQYIGIGEEDGLTMLGNDRFISFPIGLCVTPVDNNAACAAGDASCDVYKKAGETFEFEVRGKAWQLDGDVNYCDNLDTPNYAHQGMFLAHELVAPNPGELGSVSNTSYNHSALPNNLNTVTQAVNEVGVFNFTVTSPVNYIGSNFYNIPTAKTGFIGRFIPDRFVISGANVMPACGSFSYMDQPFSMSMNVSAYNTTPSYVTKNYQGSFAKATAALAGENNDDGVDLSPRFSALPIGSSDWVAGVATLDVSHEATFSRTNAPLLDGPFTQLAIGVQMFDNDGDYAFVANPDMRPDTSGNCATPSNTCTAKQISTQNLRHGRVILGNTYGPESETLVMPVTAQYWNGVDWVTNVDDSCSIVRGVLPPSATYEPAIRVNEIVTRSETGNMANGEQQLLWQNIGTTNYRGQVTAPMDVDAWLEWYWNWNSLSPNDLADPRASAFFGRYRGHDRVIYWQEVR